jgi:type IV fimbrial biogenesis protein FimT
MRHLSFARRLQAGLTLIEIMVGLGIAAALAVTAAPHFSEYTTNSRLRASGNLLMSEALLAQSEAIKRNRTVRLSATSGTVQVLDMTVPGTPVVLRERSLAPGVTAATTTTTVGVTTLDFGSEGRPMSFGTAVSIDLSMSGITCSSDLRCPGLRVDAGGALRLCGDRTSCT